MRSEPEDPGSTEFAPDPTLELGMDCVRPDAQGVRAEEHSRTRRTGSRLSAGSKRNISIRPL